MSSFPPSEVVTVRSSAKAVGADSNEEESCAVQAVVRVRPFLPRELNRSDDGTLNPRFIVSGNTIHARDSQSKTSERNQAHAFVFDKVFWSIPQKQLPLGYPEIPEHTNEDVFDALGPSAVRAVLDGYNVCFFAYGQTGSGKSHTIFGPDDHPGLAPRVIKALFEAIDESEDIDTEVFVELSFLEIYNEKVGDLLLVGNNGKLMRQASFKAPRSELKAEQLEKFEGITVVEEPDDEVSSVSFSSTVGGGGPKFKRRGSDTQSEAPSTATANLPAANFPVVNEKFQRAVASRRSLSSIDMRSLSPTRAHRNERAMSPGRRRDTTHVEIAEPVHVGRMSPRRRSTSHDMSKASHNHNHGTSNPFGQAEVECVIRYHPEIGTFIPGLKREAVTSEDECTMLMRAAMQFRATASTQMNDTSSRSHAICQLFVRQRNNIYGTQKVSLLNIVDLAGSERQKLSGVSGAQFTEAKNINLSLTTLRRVIDILIENAQKKGKSPKMIPPFRESTLTWLLNDSLGGNSKTTMLATVSPHADHFEDSVNTLRYAFKARAIVCAVKVNEQNVAVVVAAIQEEVDVLRRRMSASNSNNIVEPKLERELRSRENELTKAAEDLAAMKNQREKMHSELRKRSHTLGKVLAEFQEKQQIAAKYGQIEKELELLREESQVTQRKTAEIEDDVKVLSERLEVMQMTTDCLRDAHDKQFEGAVRRKKELRKYAANCIRDTFRASMAKMSYDKEAKRLRFDVNTLRKAVEELDDQLSWAQIKLHDSETTIQRLREVEDKYSNVAVAVENEYGELSRLPKRYAKEISDIEIETERVWERIALVEVQLEEKEELYGCRSTSTRSSRSNSAVRGSGRVSPVLPHALEESESERFQRDIDEVAAAVEEMEYAREEVTDAQARLTAEFEALVQRRESQWEMLDSIQSSIDHEDREYHDGIRELDRLDAQHELDTKALRELVVQIKLLHQEQDGLASYVKGKCLPGAPPDCDEARLFELLNVAEANAHGINFEKQRQSRTDERPQNSSPSPIPERNTCKVRKPPSRPVVGVAWR